MNEEELNIRFRQILLENIPKKKTTMDVHIVLQINSE
jgi:hypothetical protein